MSVPVGRLVTRRKLIAGSLPAVAVASAAFGKGDTPIGETVVQTDAAPFPSAWAGLRRMIEQIRSSVGASLIGFTHAGAGTTPRTVGGKLSEGPSIADFGALADDRTDASAAIQRGIDAIHEAGGGSLFVPAGKFRIERRLLLRSRVTLQGTGVSSILHLVDNRRGDALRGEGTSVARLSGIAIRGLTILGDARFGGGKPSVINGSGIAFVHADDCEVAEVTVTGFSDNGITFLNGSRNSVTNCRVEQTAQGISFTASDVSVDGNVAIGNRIFDTGEYNGLHLEGGFGGRGKGEVRNTSLTGNTVSGSWEAGINIELAPCTSCVGNTVQRSGLGKTTIGMGIKVYGGRRSAVCGNTVTDSSGYGIVIGANSGECAVSGNVTAGNAGSLLLTDSEAQVTNDVAIGSNSFAEGDIRTSGNVRILNRTMGVRLANRAMPDAQTLDWYEEGRFTPAVEAMENAGDLVREGRFTRIGNVVHVAVRIGWPAQRSGVGVVLKGLPFRAASDAPLTATCATGAGDRQPAGIVPIGAMVSGDHIILSQVARSDAGADRVRHLLIQGTYFAVE